MTKRLLLLALATSAVLALLPVAPAAGEVPAAVASEVLADLPAAAQAPDGTTTSEAVEAPMPFSMVGFDSTTGADVEVRTSEDGVTWSPWQETEQLSSDDGPDPGTAEAVAAEAHQARAGRATTEAVWVGASQYLQVRVDGADLDDVQAVVLDPEGLSRGLAGRAADAVRASWQGTGTGVATATADAADRPAITTRAQWGADERKRKGSPSYASKLDQAVVHHTAGSNTYTQAQTAAVIRGIYSWHVDHNGWSDIGYNMLVDRWGRIFEGRAGGVDRAVVGAHAAGWNTGSFGIAIMGDFSSVVPPAAARESMARAIAWKFHTHGVTMNNLVTKNGRTLNRIVGHRDVGSTSCPGNSFTAAHMGNLRDRVVELLPGSFLDVFGHTHEPGVTYIAARSITNGCSSTEYCPQRAVTRAEMASFIVRASSRLSHVSGQLFTDVPVGGTHTTAINGLKSGGITQGCDSGSTYCPNRLVTRAQMASFLVRAIPTLSGEAGNRFTDVAASSAHRQDINALASAGITQGCGGTSYCPDRPVTRGEMATFLQRAIQRGL